MEDVTHKVNQISEKIEILQKKLSDITSSLEMRELKDETCALQKKLDFIDRHSRTLQNLYTEVTGMTSEACKCDEFVRREFYDFTCHSLRAVYNDLNARVADLQSAEPNMTKEENEKLQNLLSHQRGRKLQVEKLEKVSMRLFSPVCKAFF